MDQARTRAATKSSELEAWAVPQYGAVLDATEDAVLVLDEDLAVQAANPRFAPPGHSLPPC